jgi:hypothetical protein
MSQSAGRPVAPFTSPTRDVDRSTLASAPEDDDARSQGLYDSVAIRAV